MEGGLFLHGKGLKKQILLLLHGTFFSCSRYPYTRYLKNNFGYNREFYTVIET